MSRIEGVSLAVVIVYDDRAELHPLVDVDDGVPIFEDGVEVDR